jgi:hypothetical protein
VSSFAQTPDIPVSYRINGGVKPSLNPAQKRAHRPFYISLTYRHRVAIGSLLALVEPHRTQREHQSIEIVGRAYHQNGSAGNGTVEVVQRSETTQCAKCTMNALADGR